MRHEQQHRSVKQSGFSLAELLVVIAVVGILALIGAPTFLGTLQRTRVNGTARQLATLLQLARLEAIKFSTPVKVIYDASDRRFHAFVDLDGDGVEDAGERRLAASVDLKYEHMFRGPMEADPAGAEAIDGWDDAPAVGGPTFRFDGSVDRAGAFRISDYPRLDPLDPRPPNNTLEVRIETTATGRIVLKKYHRPSGTFLANQENGQKWVWY